MNTLIFGQSARLAALAASKIRCVGASGFGPCQAIGVATGPTPDDSLLAVVVYSDYHPEFGTCQISIASWSPLWAQRGVIRALLGVPFDQYGVKKLWSMIEADNTRAIKLNLGLGFKREALLRHQFGAKRHAVLTAMMEPCYRQRWGRCAMPRVGSPV